ncbi:MAG: PDZ domain-containing protein, partial [Phycisphaerales bacterium]|nr:PDZ domain-containing protein [Phycisphaerales bacterium]
MPYSVDRYSHQVMYWAPYQGTPATGVSPRDLSSDETTRFGRNTGAVVYIVANGTPAFYANILAGDLIIQINETPITSAKDYTDYVLSNRGKEVVVLLVRNGEAKEVKLRISDEDAVSE